jgi:hypothetical protein
MGLRSEKLAVGYDFGEEHVQISYCFANGSGKEPETLPSAPDSEGFLIPMVLCKREGTNQWFFGEEALKHSQEEGYIQVDHLWQLALEGEPIYIEGEELDPTALLTLFVKKSLGMLTLVAAPPERILVIMFTARKMEEEEQQLLQNVTQRLGLKTDKIFLSDYGECFYDYIRHQPKELWEGESILFQSGEDQVIQYSLIGNDRTQPKCMYVEKTQYPFSFPGEEEASAVLSDQQFLELGQQYCEGRKVSSVYLIGDIFGKGWMKDSLRYLCKGRRVFQGSNLFSKGACYGALVGAEVLSEDGTTLYLGKNSLKANIGLKARERGEPIYYALLDGGISWKEAEKTVEFYLQREEYLDLLITPLIGKSGRIVRISLEGLEPHLTRIRMNLHFLSEDQLEAEIEDLGMGEIYPGSGKVWKERIEVTPGK